MSSYVNNIYFGDAAAAHLVVARRGTTIDHGFNASMLHEFLTTHHDVLVARTREKVASRNSPRATEDELKNGVPILLEQLADSLRRSGSVSSPELVTTAGAHGRDLSLIGFTIGQVVHDYGDVCQSVTELAVELNAPITTDEFHTLNRCLDDAIAGAVSAFALQKEEANVMKEATTAKTATERLGFLAHELRNLLTTARLSFDLLRKGTVAVGGSTGAVHLRALNGLRALVDRTLSEVRLEAGIEHRELLTVRAFMEEIELTASLEAEALGHQLTVISPADPGVTIEADRQILSSVVSNLLQNAFKFSHAQSTIIVRARTSPERVLIDVEDECGGLPPGKAESLFLPFERRSANKSGLGLGLSISRDGAKANGGQLSVRDVPGHGCVFTIDLPRRNVASTS